MPVIHELKFTPPSGQELVTITEWVENLTSDEQAEYNQALLRTTAKIQQKIEEGEIIESVKVKDGLRRIVWKDEETAMAQGSNIQDAVYLRFFRRYLRETGIQFEHVIITE